VYGCTCLTDIVLEFADWMEYTYREILVFLGKEHYTPVFICYI